VSSIGNAETTVGRQLLVLSAVLTASAFIVLFWPAFHGAMFLYGDLGTFHVPARMFYADALRHGLSPLWLPNLFCGFYLHGEGQVGMYHPLHWLLYRLLPVGAAFNLECALGYPFALAGTVIFLRRLGVPAPGAMFGALTLSSCAFLLVRLTHVNAVEVLAHTPWLLWATNVVLREGDGPHRDRALMAIAVLRGSQLLLGHPGAVWLSALCEALYGVPVAFAERRMWPALLVGIANLAGAGVGAVQLLPTVEQFAGSLRVDTSLEYRAALSLHPLSVLQPWAPYLFRDRAFQTDVPNPVEQVLYLGAVVPVAVGWVVVRHRELRAMRPLLAGALGASIVSLALALGRYGPVFWIVARLPVIGQLRVPARYAFPVFLSGAIVAAVAYADLFRLAATRDQAARRQAWWVWWSPLVSIAIAVAALALRRSLPQGTETFGTPGGLLLGPALSLVAAALWFLAAHGKRTALFGLVVLTLADHAAYALPLWWSVPPATVDEYTARIPIPPVEPASRLLDNSAVVVSRNANGQVVFRTTTPLIVHGTRLVHGYAGLMPKRRLDYRRLSAARVAAASAVLKGNGYGGIPSPLDRFRLLGNVVVSGDPASAIEGVDVATTAIVEAPVGSLEGLPRGVRVREDLPGRIALVTEAPTRQLLVVSESYHPGWRITIDGADGTVIPAYGDFIGSVLEAGTHEVVLRFAPASFRIGLWLSTLTVALVLAVATWRQRRRSVSETRRRPG